MRALAALCVLTATTTSTADRRCVIERPAAAPAVPAPAAPPCHQPARALAATLTTRIAKDFHPTQTGARPSVTFPCDGLGPTIEEIVLETGNGHGGTLNLYRARRSQNRYDVRGIAFRGASMVQAAANPPFERVTGTVTLDLDTLRAATTAVITEVVPKRKPGEGFGMSGSSSSHDFHVLIRLVDSEGRVVERSFTGYESSSSQQQFLGLVVAEAALSPITQLASGKAPVDDVDRALFADRFVAAVPSFDEPYHWWVMERYVDLARFLGTPKLIAGLLTRMKVPDPNDRSHVDARRDALEALANITGWDARKPSGSDADAAAAYLKECRQGPS